MKVQRLSSCEYESYRFTPTSNPLDGLKDNVLIRTSYDKKMFREMLAAYTAGPNHFGVKMKNVCYHSELTKLHMWMVAKTPKLDSVRFEYKFRHRLVWIVNGLTDFPRCPVCGKLIGFEDNTACWYSSQKDPAARAWNYKTHCCKLHAEMDPEHQQLVEAGVMASLGVTHPMKDKKIAKVVNDKNKIAAALMTDAQKLAATRKRFATRIRNNSVPCFGFGRTHYIFDENHFDSSWEIFAWIWYRDHGHSIRRNEKRFEYKFHGKIHGCYADFNIDGVLYEVKGDHFFSVKGDPTSFMHFPYRRDNIDSARLKMLDANMRAKQRCLVRHGVQFLVGKDIKPMKRYVEATYGKDYIKKFRQAPCSQVQKKREKLVSETNELKRKRRQRLIRFLENMT